jgi:O-antigen ligase
MFASKAKNLINWENLITLFAVALPLGRGLFNSVFILIAAYWLYKVFKGGVSFSKKELVFLVAVCAYYLYSSISLIYTENIEYGLDKVYSQSYMLFFPLFFLSFRQELGQKAYLKIFKGFLLSLTTVCVLSISKQLYSILADNQGLTALMQNSLSTSVIDNYFLGFSLLLSFSLITYTYIKQFKTRIRLFGSNTLEIIVVLILAVTLLLLNSRNLIFLTAFAVGLIFLSKSILRKKPSFFIKMFLLLIGIIGANYYANPFFEEKMKEVVNYDQEMNTDRYWGGMRKSIWDCAIKVVEGDPIIGVGIGDQKDQLELCYSIYMHNRLLVEGDNFNAHNIFLQVLLGTGLIGLALFLLSFFYMTKKAICSKNMYYLIFIGVFIFAGLTESYFERNLTVVFFSFYNCLSFFAKSNFS